MAELGFSREDLADQVREVWRSFLNMEAEPLDPSIEAVVEPPTLQGCVTVKSVWYGGVVITCPREMVIMGAIRALMVDEPSDEDLVDVIGETAGMLAGRLKTYLPPNADMSLPVVGLGDGISLHLMGTTTVLRLLGIAEGFLFQVEIRTT